MTAAASASPRRSLPYGNERLSARGMGVVVVVHVALVALLVALDVVPSPAAVVTLMVQVLPAATPVVPEVPPVPEPQPVAPQPLPKPRRAPTPPPPAPVLAAAETPAPVAAVPVAAPEPEVIEPAPAELVVTQPRFDAAYLSNPAPVYPSMSRRLREEGTVTLRVFVGPDGRPGTITVETSSGFSRLDAAAREAVARWKFVPARRGDENVEAWVVVPVIFNVRG